MKKSVISSKGQIVIPRRLREQHGWTAGTELVFEDAADGVLLRSADAIPASTLDDVIGCIRYPGKRRSIRQMDEGVRRAARRRR